MNYRDCFFFEEISNSGIEWPTFKHVVRATRLLRHYPVLRVISKRFSIKNSGEVLKRENSGGSLLKSKFSLVSCIRFFEHNSIQEKTKKNYQYVYNLFKYQKFEKKFVQRKLINIDAFVTINNINFLNRLWFFLMKMISVKKYFVR